MTGQATDELGKTYGLLTVISRAPNIGTAAAWLCRCKCDKERIVTGCELRAGRVTSCGCGRRGNPEDVTNNYFYGVYKGKAKNRGYEWDITKERFIQLTHSNCFYCGREPQHQVYGHPSEPRNGLDRINNLRGYTEDNVVPCCGPCNFAKGKMTRDEFLDLVNRIYAHHGET